MITTLKQNMEIKDQTIDDLKINIVDLKKELVESQKQCEGLNIQVFNLKDKVEQREDTISELNKKNDNCEQAITVLKKKLQ